MAERRNGSEKTSKKSELAISKKRKTRITQHSKKPTDISNAPPSEAWLAFNDTFERFRSDFEDLLFPAKWQNAFLPIPEVRVPAVDLEDRENDFVLKAEMPGFKKEDIEIEVQDDAVAITGYAGWTYDKKGKLYICKERACKTFYREMNLPEEIKIDEVSADLREGVLEITMPKKAPKQKRKLTLK